MLTFNVSDPHIGKNGAQVMAPTMEAAVDEVRENYSASCTGQCQCNIYDDVAKLSWGQFEVKVTRKWPETEATYSYDDIEYDISLNEEGDVSISVDGVWAGNGKWNGHAIEDCAANLPENVYIGLETELMVNIQYPETEH